MTTILTRTKAICFLSNKMCSAKRNEKHQVQYGRQKTNKICTDKVYYVDRMLQNGLYIFDQRILYR